MTVLITGADGFVGSHLVKDQAQRGRRVRAVDLTFSRIGAMADTPRLEMIQADIRNSDAMCQALKGVTTVFHLASAHLATTLPERDYWTINRDASRMLVELSHAAGVDRFVHCSSVGVYGKITHPPADESSPCNPDLIYERSKLAGEQTVRDYSSTSGYPVVIIRPAWVYGPGCLRTEKLFRAVTKRHFFFVGDRETKRHCIYIQDMVEALNRVASHPNAPGKTFIIGNRKASTLRGLVQEMADLAGVPAPTLTIPRLIATPLFTLVETAFTVLGQEPPLSRRSLRFFDDYSFDTSLAKREVDFEATFSIREGLRLTYEANPGSLNLGKAPDDVRAKAYTR